jgi:hypothetical protein
MSDFNYVIQEFKLMGYFVNNLDNIIDNDG